MPNLLAPVAKAKFFDNAGNPAAGYKVFTYAAGTTTKLATYTDETTGVQNANPIVLDFRGEANIWLPPNVAYKFVFAPPSDTDPPTAPIWTVDDIVNSELVTLWGGVDTGAANAYVLNFTANFTSYTDGIVIYWIPSNTNTGASTINVNGLGPVPITNQDGTALYLGQLQANQVALIVYRNTGFILVAQSLLPKINTQNANYTFQLSDGNNIVLHSDALSYTWTVPFSTTTDFPLATSIDIVNTSAATLVISPAAGVTLRPFGQTTSATILLPPFVATRLTKIGLNEWIQASGTVTSVSGTFTASVSGMTAALSFDVNYTLVGDQNIGFVSLLFRTTGPTRIGTSNATSMQMSGNPITPKTTGRNATCYGLIDNGVVVDGVATVNTDGTITFRTGSPPGNFNAAGSKGFTDQWTLVYPL